ncbi:MAG: DRTGG domain-containing protein [Dehalococcoidales bacterium]|nr:DRTGG domain-containing protein [Dehalococcoidales bacterium]
MVALYLTSQEKGSGKTAIAAGIGKHLLGGGKEVGFFKPIIIGSQKQSTEGDSDAEFIRQSFFLAEPVEQLNPVISGGSSLDSLKEAYAGVSQGKDVVIIEGSSEQYPAAPGIVKALNARLIIIESYSREPVEIPDGYKSFGESLLGIVLNKVPESRREQVLSQASARLDRSGIALLGVIPEDRALLALTIGELVERIQGEIFRGAEQSAELVENIMLGANVVDPGPDYFGRKANKAAIIRSERPDMQMAAMETSTRCLVLAGDTPLKPVVLYKAEEKNIPIILARDSVAGIIAKIEDTPGKFKFNQDRKLPRLSGILEQHFSFPTLYKGLGLAS